MCSSENLINEVNSLLLNKSTINNENQLMDSNYLTSKLEDPILSQKIFNIINDFVKKEAIKGSYSNKLKIDTNFFDISEYFLQFASIKSQIREKFIFDLLFQINEISKSILNNFNLTDTIFMDDKDKNLILLTLILKITNSLIISCPKPLYNLSINFNLIFSTSIIETFYFSLMGKINQNWENEDQYIHNEICKYWTSIINSQLENLLPFAKKFTILFEKALFICEKKETFNYKYLFELGLAICKLANPYFIMNLSKERLNFLIVKLSFFCKHNLINDQFDDNLERIIQLLLFIEILNYTASNVRIELWIDSLTSLKLFNDLCDILISIITDPLWINSKNSYYLKFIINLLEFCTHIAVAYNDQSSYASLKFIISLLEPFPLIYEKIFSLNYIISVSLDRLLMFSRRAIISQPETINLEILNEEKKDISCLNSIKKEGKKNDDFEEDIHKFISSLEFKK